MTVFKNIGVLGAGRIGEGVSECLAVEGFDVVLVDIKPDFIERAQGNIERRLNARSVSAQNIYPEKTGAILSRIHGTTDSNKLGNVPFIIECITEDRETKHDTLRRISQICGSDTVFATSISSCTISELSEGLSFAESLVGMHFFLHPSPNHLVEIVQPPKTSVRATEAMEQVAYMTGHILIRSADAPGFIVKRQSAAFFSEAVRMLNEGVANIPTIEAAAKAVFSINAGPFGIMNDRGLPVAESASQGLVGRLPALYIPPERLRAQAASGEKWEFAGEVEEDKLDAVKDRFLGLAILVGTTIVEEGVAKAEDVDLGAKFGLGWGQGPFELLNSVGLPRGLALAAHVAEVRAVPMPQNLIDLSDGENGTWPREYVELTIKDDIARITIKRPDRMNALDAEIVSQLESALKKAEKNEHVRIIVFSGLGSTLASGPSKEILVEYLEQNKIDAILSLYRKIHGLFEKIATSPKITIAHARGVTIGGGVELGLACKYLVASPRSLFAFPETGLGIHPGLGATQRLPRKVGKSIGKYVIMTGDVLTADAAERLGIVDAILDDDSAIGLLVNNLGNSETLSDDEAVPSDEEIAAISLFNPANCSATLLGDIALTSKQAERVRDTLAKKAPVALTLVNKLIDDGLGLDISKALNIEISSLGLILGTKDALKGLKAGPGETPEFKAE